MMGENEFFTPYNTVRKFTRDRSPGSAFQESSPLTSNFMNRSQNETTSYPPSSKILAQLEHMEISLLEDQFPNEREQNGLPLGQFQKELDWLRKENFDLKLKLHNLHCELEKCSNVKAVLEENNALHKNMEELSADLEVRNTMLYRANKTIQKLKGHVERFEYQRKQQLHLHKPGDMGSNITKVHCFTQTEVLPLNEDKSSGFDEATAAVSQDKKAIRNEHSEIQEAPCIKKTVPNPFQSAPLPGALPPEGNSIFVEGLYGPFKDGEMEIPNIQNESFYDPFSNLPKAPKAVSPSDSVIFVPPLPVKRNFLPPSSKSATPQPPLPSSPPPQLSSSSIISSTYSSHITTLPEDSAISKLVTSQSELSEPPPVKKLVFKPRWLPNPADVFDDIEFSPRTNKIRIRPTLPSPAPSSALGIQNPQASQTPHQISTLELSNTPVMSVSELNMKWKSFLEKSGVVTPPQCQRRVMGSEDLTQSVYFTPFLESFKGHMGSIF